MKKTFLGKPITLSILIFLSTCILLMPARAQQISLQALVTPSTVISKDGHLITFAIHGFIEFNSLAEAFPYIDGQTRRWTRSGARSGGESGDLDAR